MNKIYKVIVDNAGMQQRVLTSGFIHDKGKVLLLKRAETSGFLAGFWEMPGGKLEFGEDPMCGILREVKEEAGVDCEVVCPFHAWHSVDEYKGVQTHFVEIDFILKMKQDQKIVPADGMVDFAWASEDELDNYLMSSQMKKAVKSGFEWVSKNKS